MVWSVLRSGGRYDPLWVERLHNGVRRHYPFEAGLNFICLTDYPAAAFSSNVLVIPLKHNWSGWWSKLELWRYDIPAQPGLYLDLDNIVRGSLLSIIRPQGSYDFRSMDDALTPGNLQSAVMRWSRAWALNVGRGLFEKFLSDPDFHMRANPNGDQQFIQRHIGNYSTFTKLDVASYREDWVKGKNKGAAIIQFHGNPKIDQLDPVDELSREWR